jgi:hypothetical protein
MKIKYLKEEHAYVYHINLINLLKYRIEDGRFLLFSKRISYLLELRKKFYYIHCDTQYAKYVLNIIISGIIL